MKLPPILLLSAALVTTSHSATTFLTNNTVSKTLASNEGDGAPLAGAGSGDTRALTLSADDGAGTLNMTFDRVQSNIAGNSGEETIGMSSTAMGIGNQRWGDPSQGMVFSFDQEINFLGIEHNRVGSGTGITLSSTAWGNDLTGQSGGSGSNAWTFTSNGTTGTFSFSGFGDYDFSTGTFSSVTAGTLITKRRNSGGGSGTEMGSFTIEVIPEPSALLLSGLGFLMLLRRRR